MLTQVSSNQQKQEKIYQHLEACLQEESPEKVIERYRCLFVQATGYEDSKIRNVLESIIKSEPSANEFSGFVSHCCYLAINYWLTQSTETQKFIADLVKTFEDIPPFARFQTLSSRRIRERVSGFSKSEYFLKMKRLGYLFLENEEIQRDKSQPFTAVLPRYPFLYQDCVSPVENYSQVKESIKQFQLKQQRDFELSLSNYITNQLRIDRLAKRYGSRSEAQEFVKPTPNPTLLKEPELITVLQHFISGVQGKSTYQDLAKRFIIHSSKAETFRTYKKDLYEYLTASIEGEYGKKQFSQRLVNHLKKSLTDWDDKKPNEQLIIRTANNLLKFLIVESRQNIDHYLYLDLMTHFGPTKTIGLILKVLLISNKVYPYLTSRFAILYSHYENTPRHNVHWLFKSLENLNIALAVHNSSIDFSYWRSANSLSVTTDQ